MGTSTLSHITLRSYWTFVRGWAIAFYSIEPSHPNTSVLSATTFNDTVVPCIIPCDFEHCTPSAVLGVAVTVYPGKIKVHKQMFSRHGLLE
jgi:hypothetical protein